MPQGDIETVHVDDGWTNNVIGEGLSHLVFDSKERAIAEGGRLAKDRGVDHLVRAQDRSLEDGAGSPD